MNDKLGSVCLVGAGPGDPGLMTLKGAQRLSKAEVVVYDRLVGPEILDMIPENAERIDVGKTAGSHPVPQQEIGNILVRKAKEGRFVVRLKGGDSFVFGRGGEEIGILAENGVPFEKVIAEEHVDLVMQYGIKGAPTLVITDGENFDKYYGVPEIKKYLQVKKQA